MDTNSEREDFAAFLEAARDFCAAVESAADRYRAEVLFELGITLPALYAAALRLPDWSSETEESERLTRDAYGEAHTALADVLGDHGGDDFWDFVNLMDGAGKKKHYRHFHDSFVDDLAELYLHMKNGLTLTASGFEKEAGWEWRESWFLWGTYVTRALDTLHACLVAEAARTFVRHGPNFPVPPSSPQPAD